MIIKVFNKLRWVWFIWLPLAASVAISDLLGQTSGTGVHPVGRALGLAVIAAALPVWIKLRWRRPGLDLLLIAIVAVGPPLFREPRATFVTALIVTAALGFGRRVCNWSTLKMRGSAETFAVVAGIGFAAWIAVLTLLGATGILKVPAILLVLTIALFVCRAAIVQTIRELALEIRGWSEPGVLGAIQTMFLAVAILILQAVVIAPSTLYDPMATHLASSRYFSLHHTLTPFMSYQFLPQGYELMMAAANLLAGQGAEQLVAPLFLGLTFLAIYAIARRLGADRDIALSGAVFAIMLPLVQWNGANARNDGTVAFFLLTGLMAYLRWLETREFRWILAGSFLAAASESVKHTGLLGAAPLAILFLWAALQNPQRLRSMTGGAGIFLVFGSFWMIRAAIQHGDPLFPLRVPGMMGTATTETASTMYGRVATLASYLVHLQFGGVPLFEGQSAARLGVFFLMFAPAILWIRRADWTRGRLACLLFTVAYLGLWLATWPVMRYAIAPIALLAVGITAGLGRVLASASPWLRNSLVASIVFCQLVTCSNMVGISLNLSRLEYVIGIIDWDTCLRRTEPSYPAIAWVRDHAQPEAITLAVGNHTRAYAGDPASLDCPFDDDGPYSAEAIRKAIAARKYVYVILPRRVEAGQILGSLTPEFEDDHNAVFRLP